MINEPVEKSTLYNFDQLHEIAAGNIDFIKSLASIFLQATPVDSAALLNAADSGDWQMVSKHAHKIKSTVDSMNMLSIKNDIRTLEMDAKHKTNTAALYPLALKVNEVITEVARQVQLEFDL